MEIEILTPALDEIDIKHWFNAKYNVEQKLEIENLIENHVWITAYKKKIFVKEMETSHINNCIKCFNGEGKSRIPSTYLGGKAKWLKIFNDELLNRV